MSLVSLAKVNLENQFPHKQAINEALALINYQFKQGIRRVVIKPNLCYYWDATTGQTTSPHFVGDLIDILRENLGGDVDIAIIESDASAMRCKYVFRMLGYERLAKEKNVRLVNLTEDQSTLAEVSCNGKTFSFKIPKTISDADFKINIAHIKYTVDPVKLTCALKNIFGCNPVQKKYRYHSDLGNVIVALNKAMPFDLCLIDNTIAAGVQPCRMGLVMASQDPVALDVVCAKIAWLNPAGIPYFHVAEEEGVGKMAYKAVGAPLEQFKALYPKTTFKMKSKGKIKKMLTAVGLGKRLGL